MDVHAKIAAALHIACGALVLLVLAAIALFFGGFAALAHAHWPAVGLVAGLGGLLMLIPAALGVAQVAAGIACWHGSNVGKVCLIVFSVLGLLSIPIGTAIGAYSLWAFLRTVPDSPASPQVASAGYLPDQSR